MGDWIHGLKMPADDFSLAPRVPVRGIRAVLGWEGYVVDRFGIGAVREPVGREPSPVRVGKAQVSRFPLVGSFPVDAPTCSGPFVNTNRATVGRRPERLHEHGIVLPRLDLERFAG